MTETTEKILVGIAGQTSSGKSTAARIIERWHGAYVTKYSDILIELAKTLDRPTTKAGLQELSTELRTKHGEDYLTRLMDDRLSRVDSGVIVVEGNRRMVDMDFLTAFAEKTERELKLIYLDVPRHVRFGRYQDRCRHEGVAVPTFSEFIALEGQECERELGAVKEFIRVYGAIIRNERDDSLEYLRHAIERALRS